MVGKNQIILNLATMQEALEHYFNETQFTGSNRVKVTSVKTSNEMHCPAFTVETEPAPSAQGLALDAALDEIQALPKKQRTP